MNTTFADFDPFAAPLEVEAATLSNLLPKVAHALRKAKVGSVCIEYDGQFDLPVIYKPVYLTSRGELFTPRLPRTVAVELHAFLSDLLELRYPQWANAEGARGEFVWDVSADECSHTHSLRYTAYRTTTSKGLIGLAPMPGGG